MQPALLVALLALSLAAASRCSRDLTPHFSTTTPYAPGAYPPAPAPEGYTVVGLSSINRHGSRYPTAGKIKSFQKLEAFLDENRGSLALQWMREWRCSYDPQLEGVLWSRGTRELRGIGSRIAELYPDVLLPYNPNTVVSTSTYKPRTSQSSIAFGLGAIKAYGFNEMTWSVNEDQTGRELRFFEKCSAYINGVEDNATVAAQISEYQQRAYSAIAPKLAAATGLPVAKLLEKDRVQVMWDLCLWDSSVHGRWRGANGWCSLFDESDAAALEFGEDLDKYLNCGYGVSLSYRIAAPLLQAVVKHLDDLVAGGPVRARLRFAHAETVMPLLALLGLYRDDVPLAASMTQAQMEARQWRTSRISPMATNVFFVLATSKDGEPLVQVLHNESPVVLAQGGCADVWCPLAQIKRGYAEALATDFDALCGN
eukprot:m51a1_g908 hypothetical protein (426) ;mRNA; f:109232-110590